MARRRELPPEVIDELEELLWREYQSIPEIKETVFDELEELLWFQDKLLAPYKVIGAVSDLREFEDQATDHELISGETVDALASRISGRSAVEIMKNALDLVVKNFTYDNIHADSSRKWRSMAYTYMTAEEAARLGRGICGELSLVLLGILRRKGVPSTLIRPHTSHIAVVAQDEKGKKYMLDPTTGTITKLPDTLTRKARRPTSKYIYGPITLDEFNEVTVKKRRKFGEKLGEKLVGRPLTAEEAIDVEYARHCLKPPFETDVGLTYLDYLLDVGYCKRVLKDQWEAALLALSIEKCGRPEERHDPECWDHAWEEFESVKRMAEKYMTKLVKGSIHESKA